MTQYKKAHSEGQSHDKIGLVDFDVLYDRGEQITYNGKLYQIFNILKIKKRKQNPTASTLENIPVGIIDDENILENSFTVTLLCPEGVDENWKIDSLFTIPKIQFKRDSVTEFGILYLDSIS